MRFILFILSLLFFTVKSEAQSITKHDSNYYIINKIFFIGNKTTKEGIISRELNFKINDTIPDSLLSIKLEQSKKQLVNTELFNEVEIFNDSNGSVFVIVKEDWYIFPVPILKVADRNLNQWWLSRDPTRLNYGLWTHWYNFSGNADKLILLLNNGYTRQVNLIYTIPFVDKKKHWGFGLDLLYSSNREIGAYSEKDKLAFFSDNNNFVINRKGVELFSTYRKKLFDKQSVWIKYSNTQVADTVVFNDVNPHFLLNGESIQNKLNLGYSFIFDKRDIRGYPLNGYFLKTIIDYIAYNPNSKQVAQDFRILANANYYKKLFKKTYGSTGVTLSSRSLEIPAYEDFKALGYANQFVRGYEYYVVDGKDFFFFRSNLKYALLNDVKYYFDVLPAAFRTITLTWMVGTFFDMGYVNSPFTYKFNRLPNTLLKGYGVGTDIVMYYDRVLRLELSKNGFGKTGFYVSFYAPL